MKRFCLLLVYLLILPIFFVGCNKDNENSYQKLINTIVELQENSENLYAEQIYIEGIRISNSGYKENGGEPSKYAIKLESLIITNNTIIQRYSSDFFYYYLFCDIESVTDYKGNIIWSRD